MIDWSWNEGRNEGCTAGPSHDEAPVSVVVTPEAAGTRHVLAANNMLLGTTNLIVLNLPPGWLLRNGIQRPEVDARRVVGRYCWATLGAAHYYLIPLGGPDRVDLWVRIWPRARKEQIGAPMTFGGHNGVYRLTENGRERRLVVEWTCKKSERFMEVESRATVPLEPLLQALQGCQCHGP